MNELCKLQKNLTERKLLKLDKTLLTGHVMLEKSAKSFSGFKFENPMSVVGIAARYFDRDLVEEWFDFPAGLESSSLLQKVDRNLTVSHLPVASPFAHDDEYKFLRMLLGTNKFFKKKNFVSADHEVSTEAWKALSSGKLSDLIDVEKLVCHWNILICSACGSNETEVVVDDESIGLANLNLKEKFHVRSAIISYSERVCPHVASVAKASDVTILAPSTVPVLVGPTPVPHCCVKHRCF